jgi:hypothetical protein
MPTEQSDNFSPPSLKRALILGALLILLDAFVVNQGAIAALVGLWLLVVSLPRTFLTKKFKGVRGPRLRNITIYGAAVLLVFALNAANNGIAQNRAEAMVSAVKAYHAENQRYPNTLEELVPGFLERVPLAKYTFSFNEFEYSTSEKDTFLFYVEFPPFGRPTFDFGRNEWDYLD